MEAVLEGFYRKGIPLIGTALTVPFSSRPHYQL